MEKERAYSRYGRELKPSQRMTDYLTQELSKLEEEISAIEEDISRSIRMSTPAHTPAQPQQEQAAALTHVSNQGAATSTPEPTPTHHVHGTALTPLLVSPHHQHAATTTPRQGLHAALLTTPCVSTQLEHAPTPTRMLTQLQDLASSTLTVMQGQPEYVPHTLPPQMTIQSQYATSTASPPAPALAPERASVYAPTSALAPELASAYAPAPAHAPELASAYAPAPAHAPELASAYAPAPSHAPELASAYAPAPAHAPELASAYAPAPALTPELASAYAPAPVLAPTFTSAPVSALSAQAPVFSPTQAVYVQPSQATPVPANEMPPPSSSDAMLSKLVDLLNNRTSNRLPQMEPDVFSDDILDFPRWLSSFEALIEARANTDSERLFYLGKYTGGDAKNAIKGYMILNGSDSYVEAKATLVRRFGDKYRIAQQFKDKLHAWPLIKVGDGESMMQLADFLEQCANAMTTIHYLDSLNTHEEMIKILEKLPRYMTDRWSRTVDAWLYGEERKYPPFPIFVNYVRNEARIASGPCNSYKRSSESYKKNDNSRSVRAFATSSESNLAKPQAHERNDSKAPYCYACKGPHHISKCDEFKAMDTDNRRQIAKEKGLCYSCLYRGHLRRDCTRTGPPLLYMREDREDSETDTEAKPVISHKTHCPQQQQGLLHTMIVPVVLRDPKTNKKVSTYALLDNQSNASFITNSVARIFGTTNEVNLRLTTMSDERTIQSKTVVGLVVRGASEETEIELPVMYTRGEIPIDREMIPRPETAALWPHLAEVSEQLQPYTDRQVGLLIGFNCSAALLPRQIASAGDHDPYAIKTILGWSITGNMKMKRNNNQNDLHEERNHFTFRTQVQEVTPEKIKEMYQHEFNEKYAPEERLSIEDKKFLEQMKEMHQREDGHFELPLPLKNPVSLPNNRELAMKRFAGLRTKLHKNKQFREDYITFMKNNIDKGYAEKVPVYDINKTSGHVWYIPHHGVYHPKKPDKIRVVFDCSAEYKGESLNKHLLQGPDLTSNLSGILVRFRQEHIALTCDIEGMFHQVSVFPKHRDLLRFVWFDDENMNGDPIDYRMTVHLFGATSFPGCANYALKKTADIYEENYGSEASNFIRQNFYVDDGLRSVASKEEAKQLIRDAHDLCRRGGFKLHKFVCSDREVLMTIPTEHQDKTVQNLDLSCDSLPTTRTLGVLWHVESDEFRFKVDLKEKPITRRGILSTVSSIYDPLGFVSPMLLPGRRLLQEICTDGCCWDDSISEEIKQKWIMWRSELQWLTELSIPRCYKPKSFTNYSAELHHFSDASTEGYGQCSYLRLINQEEVHTALVMGKSRVAPSKQITIPRLELTAAVLSVKVAAFLDRELEYDVKHFFWTDSMVVLGYIANEVKRFHIYVANRVQQIRDFSNPDQWNHVRSEENPADLASRGMKAQDLKNSKLWWHGPDFLKAQSLPSWNMDDTLSTDDPEVKVTTHAIRTQKYEHLDIDELLTSFSSWHCVKRAVAVCLRYIKKLKARVAEHKQHKIKGKGHNYNPVNTEEIQEAEIVIIRQLQMKSFPQERQCLINRKYANGRLEATKRNERLKQSSALFRLDPFVGDDELIRVGGRVRRANIPRSLAHPVILPKDSYLTRLLIQHFHEKNSHSGRNTTMNEIRSSGFWILKARSVITRTLRKCVKCRRLFGQLIGQKMADLPADRLEPAPPFTYTGVDFFGPFYVKEGRSERKRWGALFTCLVCRAIHIEVAHSLSTDSFLNAYRRFIGRRGPVRQIRCDRGTNFTGARNELNAAMTELDNRLIKQELLKNDCDWVEFKMNMPHASHMGGAWERMIRSVRRILSSLMDQHGNQLNDELLHTLMIEAEAVVNSRPLTYQDTNSPDAQEPLTPNHILTLKSKVVYPPPGQFVKEDLYCRKRWRRVQYLANEFWSRWRKEYLCTLQDRQKWSNCQENLKVGDIVLVSDECTPRSQWPLAVVTDVFQSEDTLVRKVTVKTVNSILERPIHKLVMLYRPDSEPENSPTRSLNSDHHSSV